MADQLTLELVETSTRLLEAELGVPRGFDTEPLVGRWKAVRPHLEGLGWFDLLGDPDSGGLGLTPRHAIRLLRLGGAHLVPGPLVEAVLTVPWLLRQPGVASGLLEASRLAVTTVDSCPDLPGHQGVRLRDGRLTGTVRWVLGAPDAEALLVVATADRDERLVVLPATHPGVHIDPQRGADPCQSVGHVELDCAVDADHVVGSSDDGLAERLRAWTRLGSAALLAGIAEGVLPLGVQHALSREQFGRPIGGFQAIQHLLADVAVSAQSLGHLVDSTSDELEGADAVLAAAAAKARAGAHTVEACETVLQVLGGIGFTVEHPLHHYLKRAVSLAAGGGTSAELDLLVGRLVLTSKETP